MFTEESKDGHRTQAEIAEEKLPKKAQYLKTRLKDESDLEIRNQLEKQLERIYAYLRCIRRGIEPDDFRQIAEDTGIQEEKLWEIYNSTIKPALDRQTDLEWALGEPSSPSPEDLLIQKETQEESEKLAERKLKELAKQIRQIADERRGKRRVLLHAVADNVQSGYHPLDYGHLERHFNAREVSFPSRSALYKATHDAKKILLEKLPDPWRKVFEKLLGINLEKPQISEDE